MNIGDFNKEHFSGENIEQISGYEFKPSHFKNKTEYVVSLIVIPLALAVLLLIIGIIGKFQVNLLAYMILWFGYYGLIMYRWVRVWKKIYKSEESDSFRTYNFFKFNTAKIVVDKNFSNKVNELLKYKSAIWAREVEKGNLSKELGEMYTTYYRVEEIVDGDEDKIDTYLAEVFKNAYTEVFKSTKKQYINIAQIVLLVLCIFITSGFIWGIIFSLIAVFLHNLVQEGFDVVESAYDFDYTYEEFKEYMELALELDSLPDTSHRFEDIMEIIVLPPSHHMVKVYSIYYAKELKGCSTKFLANEIYNYTLDNVKIDYVTSDDGISNDGIDSIDMEDALILPQETLSDEDNSNPLNKRKKGLKED